MQNLLADVAEKKVFFSDLLALHKEGTKGLKSKTTRYGSLRLLVFIIALVSLVYFINERNGSLAFAILLVGPFLFGWLVNLHNKYKRALKLNLNKEQVLQEELKRLELDLKDLDGGEEFIDHQHPYTTDMDVFGKHSLFALINRSTLTFGRSELADWFKARGSEKVIRERQAAVESLQKDYDFMLNWWSENRAEKVSEEQQNELIFHWFENKDELQLATIWKLIPIIGLIQFWATVFLAVTDILPNSFMAASLFLNLLLLVPIQNKVISTQRLTDKLSAILNQHINLFSLALNKETEDPLLKRLINTLKNPNAPQNIRKLNKILNWLHARNGMMYWIVDPFVMTDYWVLIASINWKNNFGMHIRKWFNTIGEMEALLSLANYSFVHTSYRGALVVSDVVCLEGVEIGHPLIKHEERVNNDFHMEKAGSISLITGANMSGKSTFERALGVNIILGQMGAVCCADNFKLSPLQLFTSMRTQDNLAENTSSFYAELKRLKQLVELTRSEKDVAIFYLLDEILKGTNSEDRNKGAESLIKQLIKTNSMGLISTHDLSLAELTDQLELFANYSFNSEVNGEEILFDYKLTDGPCHTFNAVPLMRKMGIEIVD